MLKEKKIPLRSCVITREKFPKKELLRVVRTPEGEVKLDLTGKMNGHGAYIKKDKDVIEKAMKNKALDKYLETTISEDVYQEMINSLEV
ncbi:MAG: YlxR family protein [Bacilli bacterium]|nr:YlxR family protein [Bacilli bacterium]